MKAVLDTRAIAPADRLEFWIEDVLRGRDSRWQVDARRAHASKFFASLESIRGAGGVVFNRYRSDPLRVFRPEPQADEDDHFILASTSQLGGVVDINGEECLCPPGRWVLIDKRFPVSLNSSHWRRDTKYGVDIPRHKLTAILGREVEMPRPWLISSMRGTPAGLLCDTLDSAFHQLFDMADPVGPGVLLGEQACNLLGMALADTPAEDSFATAQVDEALRYMANHHAERRLSAGHVARSLGISVSLLYQRFAQRGLRFSIELRRIRCEQAALILRDYRRLHWTVEAVAQATGFSGSAPLIRAFRERYAVTPARFRNNMVFPQS